MISEESDVQRHCFASFQPVISEIAPKTFSLAHPANTEFSSRARYTSKNIGWVHAHCARSCSPHIAQNDL